MSHFRCIVIDSATSGLEIFHGLVEYTLSLQKPESFRAKASEGEVVVFYFEPSATQDLKFSGFPGG